MNTFRKSFVYFKAFSNVMKHEFCTHVNKVTVRKNRTAEDYKILGQLDPNYLKELNDSAANDSLQEKYSHFDNNMTDLIQKQKLHGLQWIDLQTNIAQYLKNKKIENVNYTILSKLVVSGFFEQGELFCKYMIESDSSKVNIATVAKIFELYYEIHKNVKLSEEQKKFVLDVYDIFHKRHSLFDPVTNAKAIGVISLLGNWEICLDILNEIKMAEVPMRYVYTATIACLFRSGQVEKGWSIMDEMLVNGRMPQNEIFIAWLEFCSHKFTHDKGKMEKWIERMLFYWKIKELKIDSEMATIVKNVYKDVLKWNVKPAYINYRGVCSACCHILENDPLTMNEYEELKSNFMNNVIINKNIFFKSSPKELEQFVKHITKLPYYDMVLDALNVVMGSGHNLADRRMLYMLEQLADEGRKVLILGRKHLRRLAVFKEWQEKSSAIYLLNDQSQDDPFMLYAAMAKGPNTDFVSNDLMKSHSCLLRNDNAQMLFLRWQRQHQFRLLYVDANKMVLRRPIQYAPFPQKANKSLWHVPYAVESVEHQNVQLDMEGPKQWLCMRSPVRSVRPMF